MMELEIEIVCGGKFVFVVMCVYYKVVGKYWININYNYLCELFVIEIVGDYIIFMDEN